ncbi:MAG: helix-turn-helix domain containing protein [Nitratireductor sp.]|uniref:helix-turn-helix domain containing protein n=1 Tax=Parvibaculum sp. TaxID=2024848 RepID=UPI003284F49C
MNITETRRAPEPPAHIAPYVAALGVDDAVRFFLALGGADIYVPRRSSPRSIAARTIGAGNVEKLAEVIGSGYIKVPLARQWVAQVMQARGDSLAEIARTVRADVATVRRWLGPSAAAHQMDLFS